ncbi:MAG: hypothetical protein LC122_12610 [Chitinophagales bacterium]|nr:hypothetical protein [Chitinophagales bacterium]
MSKNFSLKLNPRKDSEGRTFYVAKVEAPVMIDCREGAAFLVFIAESGKEELQIAVDKDFRD